MTRPNQILNAICDLLIISKKKRATCQDPLITLSTLQDIYKTTVKSRI